MLTREQYEALVQRLTNGETLTHAELSSMQAYQRAEAGTLSQRLATPQATADDAARVDALADETQRVNTALAATPDPEQARRNVDAARQRIAELVGAGAGVNTGTGSGAQGVDTDTRGGRPGDGSDDRQQRLNRLSVGQRFAEHADWQAFIQRGFVGSASVDFPTLEARALIDSTGVGLNGSRNPYVGTIDQTPDRPLRLADLIDRQTTDLGSVPYLIEGLNTGAAAEVAEGAAKPEATFTFTEDSAPVRTIAHWVPITRQAAEDNSTLVGYINGRLAYGLELRLDAQILNGNGTAPNLRGIMNTSGIGTYTPGAAEARIITIRKAITLAQISEYQPDTVVLHPTDWQGIELDTDNNGAFRVTTNPQNALTPRLWGLNVVVTTAITVANYLVGAFRMGATLWERHGVRLLVSDSHGTNFTSNILVLLAEMRAALTVWRPAAFVKGAFV
jgi:HK97 family phage major capsid protein